MARTQHAEQARTRISKLNFDPAADFAKLVIEATSLRAFTTDLVPATFQLPEYTNAAMQADEPVRVARLAMVREAWLTRLGDKDSLAVHAVFPEAVLWQTVGGPRVMKAQLLHLMEVSEHQAVSVQVVPRAAGAYPAMGSPFTLLMYCCGE